MESTERSPVSACLASPGADGADTLSYELADAFGAVLGHPVDSTALLPRRDGAVAPVIGLMAVVPSHRCRTAAQLVHEWVATGSAEPERGSSLVSPVPLELPSLQVAGRGLLGGLRLVAPATNAEPVTVLAELATTVATLVGGIREAVVVRPGHGYERVPGWIARLRMLARKEELGSAERVHDALGQWVCDTQQNASSIYVPDAAMGCLWLGVMEAIREWALAALRGVDEALPAGRDFHRRTANDFWKLIDRSQSVVLDDHPNMSGNVLQNVRLPRMSGGRVIPGIALLEPGKVT